MALTAQKIKLSIAFVAAAIVFSAGALMAHPYHQSVLELEASLADNQLQGALKLLPEDADTILRSKSLAHYLQQHVRVTLDEQPLALRVQGVERSPKAVWIFLTWPLTGKPCTPARTLTIDNRILFEVNDHFVNTIVWRENDKKQPRAHNLTPLSSRLVLDLATLIPACTRRTAPNQVGS